MGLTIHDSGTSHNGRVVASRLGSVCLLIGSLVTCAPATSPNGPNHANGPTNPAPEQSAAPISHPKLPLGQVVTSRQGEVTLHSLTAPEVVAGVSSHVIETSHHLVVVDTQLAKPHTQQLRDLCASLEKPIERVIISHGHPDHYFGAAAFGDVPVYTFPEVRRSIEGRLQGHIDNHVRMEGKEVIPQTVKLPATDLETGSFEVDGVAFVVERVADAEDVTQAIVWLPEQKVLIAQDLVSNGYHAFFGTGPVDAWLTKLAELEARKPTVVLAGHGPPGDARLLATTAEYLRKTSALAAEATSKEELIAAIDAAYPNLKGHFLVEITAVIIFRDRRRAADQ